MKKIIFAILTLFVTVSLTGCSFGKSNSDSNASQQRQSNGRSNASSTPQIFSDPDYPQGTVTDIKIGASIMAMGMSNADGSMFVDRVFIGSTTTDFTALGLDFGLGPNINNSTATLNENTQRIMPPSTGEMPANDQLARPDFNNLSEEEKQAMQERMQNLQNNQPISGSKRLAGAGSAQGEVLQVDSSSITVKLISGGTKFLFISDNTKIYLVSTDNTSVVTD